ncbi:MAG TPA: protein kinase [Candidatus Sulfotelmatobacter sp.]|nr:protein kinase [Candidatus Sulfotelmatobacter sp.]
MAPARIAGRYELKEQLGEGGMGVVYRALDTKTGSYVAIKIMKDISDPVAVELFAKEWRALAEMCHPNIVDVRDVDVLEENKQRKPFFVMPLLNGCTMAELIANSSARLTIARTVEIISQVCKGLQAAHQRGLIHRDLKPSNIFVMDDDTAKIIDFGVVHLAGSKSITGQKGTYQYMSPEQAQLKEITPASDIFSLGVILYEALTLRKPFARPTAEETVMAVCKYFPPPVSEINPAVNQQVSKVVHKCLAKQPMHRFSNARDLAETLQKAFRNETVFDPAKIQPRIERAKAAFKAGDDGFASEIVAEIEAEGHLDPQITVLRTQIDLAVRQKKVRQLLESARSRMEQDEIPLALDKVREVLELDPENTDALAMRQTMEKQRSENQIAKWLDLAHTHLENRDFGAARHAVQEVLTIRAGDTRALDMLEAIESTEADAKRIREQKEQLYSSALKAYQNGEIDTALSKLERLFSVARLNPEAAVPERDAVYQSFYKEVRSEHNSLHSAIEEAQRQFSEKNFAGALKVCQDMLAKHPNDGAFHALKIQIEDAERQELSAYIAEISKRVEAEPDLNRRANILKEANERYPNEPQFAQQLKVVRERRDLVNSIAAKARQYEERGQYSEAISQWDTLRNIHPQYPGISFEVEQCKKKRDRQAFEEEKNRQVGEIEAFMEARSYSKAIDAANGALAIFPGDAELLGLQQLAEQALDRARESRRLLEEGQLALGQKDFSHAADLLRSAMKTDPRAPGLRDTLINVLTEWARLVVEEDWHQAEPIYLEANELDSTHPAVRSLRSTISEAKRTTFVGQRLAEARPLVASGQLRAALQIVQEARGEYPNDKRLAEYETNLRKDLGDIQLKEERNKDRAGLAEYRHSLDQNPDRNQMRVVLEQSQVIRARHPDDSDIGEIVAEIEQTVKRVAKVENLDELLGLSVLRTGTDGAAVAPAVTPRKRPQLLEPTIKFPAKDPAKQKEKITRKNPFEEPIRKISALGLAGQQRTLDFLRPGGSWSKQRLGIIGGSIITVAAVAFVATHWPLWHSKPSGPAVVISQVHIIPDPSDSTITVDSKLVPDGMVSVSSSAATKVEVSHLGYKTETFPLQPGSDGKVTLTPEPIHLELQTSDGSGAVELDGQSIGNLSDGSFEGYDLPPDNAAHTISVIGQSKKPLFTIEFQATVGQRPRVNALNASDMFVISSLGANATLYAGQSLKNVRIGNQTVDAVSTSGVDLPALTDQAHELQYGEGSDQGSIPIEISNAPELVVRALDTSGQILITTNVTNATLTVDGVLVRRQKRGWLISKSPGNYHFVLAADGYQPQTWTASILRRRTFSKNITLVPKVVAPVTASLVISGGTPAAEIVLDGKRVGELDANGNAQFADALQVGPHTLLFRKAGYDEREIEVAAKTHEDVHIPPGQASLVPWGVLLLNTTAKNLVVKYRRVGDAQFQSTAAPARISLPPGEYEFSTEPPTVPNGKPQRFTMVSGQSRILNFTAMHSGPEIADPSQVVTEGDWFKAKNPGSYVYLRPGVVNINVIFTKPKNSIWGAKKVHWSVESDDGARLEYELTDQKISRKLMTGEDTSNQKSAKADATSATQNISLSVHIQIEGVHVRVTSDRGEILDDYSALDHDFSRGRLGIKTDSLFMIRSN